MITMAPARRDIVIYTRSDFEEVYTFKDGSGNPINITNHEFFAQFWDTSRTRLFADFTLTKVDAVNGVLRSFIDHTVTRTLSKSGVWDLLVDDGSGERKYWLKGNVSVQIGATDAED